MFFIRIQVISESTQFLPRLKELWTVFFSWNLALWLILEDLVRVWKLWCLEMLLSHIGMYREQAKSIDRRFCGTQVDSMTRIINAIVIWWKYVVAPWTNYLFIPVTSARYHALLQTDTILYLGLTPFLTFDWYLTLTYALPFLWLIPYYDWCFAFLNTLLWLMLHLSWIPYLPCLWLMPDKISLIETGLSQFISLVEG